MELILTLLKFIIPIWIVLVLIMLPVFFRQKKKMPNDESNTLKSLILKSLIASAIFVVIFCSGLIAMYFDEI